jgi:hypothetical protein
MFHENRYIWIQMYDKIYFQKNIQLPNGCNISFQLYLLQISAPNFICNCICLPQLSSAKAAVRTKTLDKPIFIH